MTGFTSIELGSDETIVFGPVTTTRNISVSGQPAGTTQQQLTHASGRTIGVTNQRIVIEDLKDSSKSKIIPNDQVQRVFISTKHRQGQASSELERVELTSGQSVKLDLKGLPAQAEATLKEIFPQAEIVQGKGGSKGVKIIAILAGVAIFLFCILPVLILLIGRLIN